MVEVKRKSTCQYLSRSFVQGRLWPFSRLQTMVTWFVKVVAAKMTDVDRQTMQRKGTSLGDRSDWEDENRGVSGCTWSLA